MMEETMFLRSVFTVLLAAAGVCRADGLTIEGPTTVEPYRIVRLDAKGVPEKAGVIWNITPKVNGSAPDWATSNHSRKALWTGKPGTYTVQLIAASVAEDRTVTLESTEIELKIGADPAPPPAPPTPPAPDAFAAAVTGAYKAAPDAEAAVWLSAVYAEVAETVVQDQTLTTLRTINDVIVKSCAKRAPLPRLQAVRTLIQKENTAVLGADGAATLTPELRQKCKQQFLRIAAILGGLAK
jgi:hypothetical protein